MRFKVCNLVNRCLGNIGRIKKTVAPFNVKGRFASSMSGKMSCLENKQAMQNVGAPPKLRL
jgi:hypothetical protein